MDGGPETPYEHAADIPPPGPVQSLFGSLAQLAATLVAVAQTRLQLLTTELQQEMYRIAGIMVWTVVAVLALGIGLFTAALVVVFIFWDTHRILASVLVTSLFFVIGIGALLVLRAKVKSKPRLLEGTLAELATDANTLKAAARVRKR